MSDFLEQEQVVADFSASDNWIVLSPLEQSIKKKIEAVGTPLKDWKDIKIYRGVLTGCNEAFIIDSAKREEILLNCQSDEERERTAELIRPILRGRDIKRYGYVDNGLYLINTHNGIKDKLPRIDIKEYPAIKAHLDQYWDKISTRTDKGDTPYNLRSCAYLDLFFQPKICWKAVGRNLAFAIVESGIFLTAPASFISAGEHNEFILAMLHSKLGKYFIYQNSDTTGAGDIMLNIQSLTGFPIPKSCEEYSSIKKIVKSFKEKEPPQIQLEEIDNLIYKMYNFSPLEKELIENI